MVSERSSPRGHTFVFQMHAELAAAYGQSEQAVRVLPAALTPDLRTLPGLSGVLCCLLLRKIRGWWHCTGLCMRGLWLSVMHCRACRRVASRNRSYGTWLLPAEPVRAGTLSICNVQRSEELALLY